MLLPRSHTPTHPKNKENKLGQRPDCEDVTRHHPVRLLLVAAPAYPSIGVTACGPGSQGATSESDHCSGLQTLQKCRVETGC